MADLLGADPRGIVFGRSMTAADLRLRPRRSPRLAAGRRGGRHPARPRRQHPARGCRPPRRSARWCAGPTSTRATGELDRRRRGARAVAAHPAGGGHRRVQPARHPAATWPRSPPRRTRRARCSTSTACTSPRTRRSTSPRWAPTSSPARRTSSSARTAACSPAAPDCWSRCTRTSCCRPPTPCPSASSWHAALRAAGRHHRGGRLPRRARAGRRAASRRERLRRRMAAVEAHEDRLRARIEDGLAATARRDACTPAPRCARRRCCSPSPAATPRDAYRFSPSAASTRRPARSTRSRPRGGSAWATPAACGSAGALHRRRRRRPPARRVGGVRHLLSVFRAPSLGRGRFGCGHRERRRRPSGRPNASTSPRSHSGPELIGELAAAAGGTAPVHAHQSRPLGHLLRHRGPAPVAEPPDAAAPQRRFRRGLAPQASRRRGSRDEVRQPLGRHRKPPAPLVALSRAAHRGAPLQPVVELDTVREEWTLTDAQGEIVATVTDDKVTARHLATGVESGGTGVDTEPLQWAEIEVELAGQGSPEVLDRIEEALLAGRGAAVGVGVQARPGARRAGPARARRGRWPTRTRPRARSCWPTWPSRPRRSGRVTRRSAAAPRTPCTPCAWPAAGCAARSSPSARCWMAAAPTTSSPSCAGWRASWAGPATSRSRRRGSAADVAALPPELALGPVAAQTTRFFSTRRASASATTHGRAGQRPLSRAARRRRRAAGRPPAHRGRRTSRPSRCCRG